MAIPTAMSGSSPRWLRFFILAMCALGSLSKNITQISYFSFISLAQNTTAGPRSNLVIFTQLLQTDDSPFASIDLPWKFNFLGENINRMFINPNGGLHASPVQPCPPDNYFGTADCDFRNSYYQAIGGLFTDLNPHSSANGNITSYRGSDHVTIDYYKIAYYGSAVTNNFRIVVYKDSHIEIIYDEIFRNNNLPENDRWVSGMRGSSEDDFAYFSPVQLSTASAEWGTVADVPGIYPSKASVISGNQFNICPVARVWCASPNTVSRNSSFTANPTEFITFTTTLLSCVNIVQYGAIFTSHSVSMSGEMRSIPCTVVHNTSLQCNISTLLNTSIPAGEYDVTPVWRLNHSEPFQALLVDSLLVTIVNNSLFNSATQSYDPSIGCTNNANTTACASDGCALCQGDYACLDVPCPSVPPIVVSSSVPAGLSSSVYDRVTCRNTCPVFSTNPSDTYFTDFNRTCCAESAMDCSGRCEGVSEVAVDTDGAVICCSPPHIADCAGVCDGTAVLDQCGICEGDGLNCYDPADVTITTILGGSSFYPVYDITTPNGWKENLLVNVTNWSMYTIKVVFQENPVTLLVNPVLTLPNTTMYVPPYSWINVTISSSIASLVQANSTTWANKQFTAQYERNVTSIPSNEVSLLIYPQVTGCDTLHSARSACLRLPGCIYCFTNPYMRLLRGASTSAAVHDLETNTSLARKLFIELLPPVQGQAENYLYGMCADGYLTKDCSAVAPFYFTSGGHSAELRFGMYFTFFLAIIFNSFLLRV